MNQLGACSIAQAVSHLSRTLVLTALSVRHIKSAWYVVHTVYHAHRQSMTTMCTCWQECLIYCTNWYIVSNKNNSISQGKEIRRHQMGKGKNSTNPWPLRTIESYFEANKRETKNKNNMNELRSYNQNEAWTRTKHTPYFKIISCRYWHYN